MNKTAQSLGFIAASAAVLTLLSASTTGRVVPSIAPQAAVETVPVVAVAPATVSDPVTISAGGAQGGAVAVATKATPKPSPTPAAKSVITLRPVPGNQATIDQGKLVQYFTSPTCLLAGHDTSGWHWLDTVPTGREVRVATGDCVGMYRVVGHKWQSVKGGPIPSWMGDYDLVLQTCTGSSGMGFSLLQKI